MSRLQQFSMFLLATVSIITVNGRNLTELLDDRKVAPTENGGPVVVSVGTIIQRIVDFDDDKLTVDMGILMSWTDNRLKELTAKTGRSLHLRPEDVWIPDVTPYERVKGWDFNPNVRLSHPDGTLHYTPVSRLYTDKCTLKSVGIRQCTIRVGTWTYDTTEVDLQPTGIQFYEYQQHQIFEITNSSVSRHPSKDPCCGTFPAVKISFDIRTR